MHMDTARKELSLEVSSDHPPEHHQIQILARRCMGTAQVGSSEQIRSLCREAADYCTAWKPYFEREEALLFPICETLGGDLIRLCRQLQEEHRELLRFCLYLKEGECSALYGFGALLHAHCRAETRVLLPMVEAHLDGEALARLRRGLAGERPADASAAVITEPVIDPSA